ncbi:MAG: Asp23/Gls24 family envelope stress response protein [Firmicutes bacterium]|nr:Asp23/Gls24 family envelope stress response protein [Bacillota bacterium]
MCSRAGQGATYPPWKTKKEGNLVVENGLGRTKVAEEVVAIIAGLAATEIDGVAGMSGGIVSGIAERLGRKDLTRGVKVEVGEEQVAVDLFVITHFGMSIPTIAQNIKENVKKKIESMTGMEVVEVNVNVQGVHMEAKEVEQE